MVFKFYLFRYFYKDGKVKKTVISNNNLKYKNNVKIYLQQILFILF